MQSKLASTAPFLQKGAPKTLGKTAFFFRADTDLG